MPYCALAGGLSAILGRIGKGPLRGGEGNPDMPGEFGLFEP